MRLSERIRQAVSDDISTDPKSIARRFLKEVPHREMVSMLAEEIAETQRARVRQAEKTAFKQFGGGKKISRGASKKLTGANMARLRKVFDMPVSLGGGFRREWGSLTIGEHERRISFLMKQRDGLTAESTSMEERIDTEITITRRSSFTLSRNL